MIGESRPAADNDAQLAHHLATRDPRGIAALHDCFGGVAYACAYRLLGDRVAAEDVVQDVFLNLWRRGTTYNPARGTPRAWLLGSIRNRAIDQLRHRQFHEGRDVEFDETTTSATRANVEATVMMRLEGERLGRALTQLPAAQRQVVLLAFSHGLSHSEIATRLQLPLGTAKGRMRLALAKLRHGLEQ